MSNAVSFADVLFILFVCGIIYFFVYWFGPARKAKADRDDQSNQTDSQP
jgi:hypothetical protein